MCAILLVLVGTYAEHFLGPVLTLQNTQLFVYCSTVSEYMLNMKLPRMYEAEKAVAINQILGYLAITHWHLYG